MKGAVTANVEVLGVAYDVNKEEATVISLNIIFVIQTTCVFCEGGNKCLNIIWINLGFKFSIYYNNNNNNNNNNNFNL